MYLTETIEANVYIFLYIGFASVFSSFSPFFFSDVEYYMKVIPVDSPRVGHQTLHILIFLNFSLYFQLAFKILIQSIQKYLQSFYFFGRRVVCAQTAIFFNKSVSKICGNYIHFMFEAAWRRMSRLTATLYLGAQNFKLFSKIQNKKIKNLIHIAVNVLL
jgi:hypothetical protein